MRNPRVWFGGVILALTLLGAYSNLPGSRVIRGEDGIIEWASAGLFAYAACIAAFAPPPPADRWDRALRYYVIALAGICCLSELSFGARIFGWNMPNMVGGGEIDGAQDLVLVTLRTLGTSTVLILLAICLSAMLVWAVQHRAALQGIFAWVMDNPSRSIVAAASLALLVALGCDVMEQPRLRSAEELIELSAAALLALSQIGVASRPGLRFASSEKRA
jgi:hypothetical protein